MPCQMKPTDNSCAHSLSLAWAKYYPALMNGNGVHFDDSGNPKVCRCGCKAMVRAIDVRNWASSIGAKVPSYQNEGVYVIFQWTNIEAGGHVWGMQNGIEKGNGNYNSYPNRLKNQVIYKLK